MVFGRIVNACDYFMYGCVEILGMDAVVNIFLYLCVNQLWSVRKVLV
jgi:hypothetical protein